jgi:hypothetical protein
MTLSAANHIRQKWSLISNQRVTTDKANITSIAPISSSSRLTQKIASRNAYLMLLSLLPWVVGGKIRAKALIYFPKTVATISENDFQSICLNP